MYKNERKWALRSREIEKSYFRICAFKLSVIEVVTYQDSSINDNTSGDAHKKSANLNDFDVGQNSRNGQTRDDKDGSHEVSGIFKGSVDNKIVSAGQRPF